STPAETAGIPFLRSVPSNTLAIWTGRRVASQSEATPVIAWSDLLEWIGFHVDVSARYCLVPSPSFPPLLRRRRDRLRMRLRRILVDPPLDLRPEVPDEPLHRPGGAVAEGADGVAFDLGRHLHQRVDLTPLRAPFGHAGEHAPHPAHAFAAGRPRAAARVLVAIGHARRRTADVGGFRHHGQ